MTNALKLTVPEGQPFIDTEREFDFPVEDVFRAHKDPAMITQWLGPRGLKMEMDHYDFRTGGSYSYVHTGPDGVAYKFNGVFHVVRENEFAIQTFEYDGQPDVVAMDYMRFEALEGDRCRLVGHSVYPTVEARDGMAASGMEGGITEGYERLDTLLSTR